MIEEKKIRIPKFEDSLFDIFFNSPVREGSPTLINDFECCVCGSLTNLIRDVNAEEPCYCIDCVIHKEEVKEIPYDSKPA